MTQHCIDRYRILFSCRLVELAKRYDSLLCMNLDTTKTLADIILARNLLTTLCIIQDSNCYDIYVAEKIIGKINNILS